MLRLVVVVVRSLLVLRVTCGVVVARLVVEVVLRVTCGVVALVLRLTVLVLRVAAGATVLLERETAAVWLLLLVLPP